MTDYVLASLADTMALKLQHLEKRSLVGNNKLGLSIHITVMTTKTVRSLTLFVVLDGGAQCVPIVSCMCTYV